MEINGEVVNEIKSYEELGLSEGILRALHRKGFTTATPIQSGAIPFFLEGRDVIAKAPTGTGKTFAFGIPMLEHIRPEDTIVRGLILAPTRELALQIRTELRDLCVFQKGIRIACLYGGQPIEKQIAQLKKQPQLVVATPGRLMDHMKRHAIRLDHVETVVLDEADRMLDMGFIHDVTHILERLKARKNMGLFSATISREVMDISWIYQRDPVEITVPPDPANKPDIDQYRIETDRQEKVPLMISLLQHGGYERAIAFCNTKNTADRLTGLLQMGDVSCEAIHSAIPQAVREKTLRKFRTGGFCVLVATDVAARGLDIDDIEVVFNYDIPDENEYYIHRIGRTGRAKRHGVAYSFVCSVAEDLRMNEIASGTRNTIRHLRYRDGFLENLDPDPETENE